MGKTHLAVSILQQVVVQKALPALFVDLNDLYREIRATYGRYGAEETEYDILAPLREAPLLLIDELGCVASPWAQDTLHYLVSQRYNEQRPTLLTTNYLDAPPSGRGLARGPHRHADALPARGDVPNGERGGSRPPAKVRSDSSGRGSGKRKRADRGPPFSCSTGRVT